MKVIYESIYLSKELSPEQVFYIVPSKAVLRVKKDKNDGQYECIYKDKIITSDETIIECNQGAEVIVKSDKNRQIYSVKPLVQPLSIDYSRTYNQFLYEYKNIDDNIVNCILNGRLRLYALDQSVEVKDYSKIFKCIEDSFSAFKFICEKPKSHLRSVNEVRPIETVKRVGYESIPYLASHSEDWLARTASGLKPARLFSRVEDDEYQIYENRVVKTLIDLLLGFLRKEEKQLRDQLHQLRSIINSSVQTGSFGFDVTFQKAVSELMSSTDEDEKKRLRNYEKAEKFQKKAYSLLRKYRTLRKTKLYRYLKRVKAVQNPLNETNILLLDKHYSVIYKLWKTILHDIALKAKDQGENVSFSDLYEGYYSFCATLCDYVAHILNFELINDSDKKYYLRKTDQIKLEVTIERDGSILVALCDNKQHKVKIPNGVDVPTNDAFGFSYDCKNKILSWPNDINEKEIDDFCSLLKTKESWGKEQSEEKHKYKCLKRIIVEAQRSYSSPQKTSFVIIPAAVELNTADRSSFKDYMETVAEKYLDNNHVDEVVISLPLCSEDEQAITEYAKNNQQKISILPLTMFDINSFRRIQNLLYRHILKISGVNCPNCGGEMYKNDNQMICRNCQNLMLTKTTCPNAECKHEYYYLNYAGIPFETIQKMQEIKQDDFFQKDSLFQYKDIVNMIVEKGKILPICPQCHNCSE